MGLLDGLMLGKQLGKKVGATELGLFVGTKEGEEGRRVVGWSVGESIAF